MPIRLKPDDWTLIADALDALASEHQGVIASALNAEGDPALDLPQVQAHQRRANQCKHLLARIRKGRTA